VNAFIAMYVVLLCLDSGVVDFDLYIKYLALHILTNK
jgi:hypothetical protein